MFGVSQSQNMPIPAHIRKGMKKQTDTLLDNSDTISTIETNVATNTGDIATNAGAISSLDERVVTLETAV